MNCGKGSESQAYLLAGNGPILHYQQEEELPNKVHPYFPPSSIYLFASTHSSVIIHLVLCLH